jgi:hypothetical protein
MGPASFSLFFSFLWLDIPYSFFFFVSATTGRLVEALPSPVVVDLDFTHLLEWLSFFGGWLWEDGEGYVAMDHGDSGGLIGCVGSTLILLLLGTTTTSLLVMCTLLGWIYQIFLLVLVISLFPWGERVHTIALGFVGCPDLGWLGISPHPDMQPRPTSSGKLPEAFCGFNNLVLIDRYRFP